MKPETTDTHTDHRRRDFERGRSKKLIQTVVEAVSAVRGVDPIHLMSSHREGEAIASARTFAMAACHAVGVPICHTALAFRRKWQTVYSAETQCSNRYRNSADFRKEWDTITNDILDSQS